MFSTRFLLLDSIAPSLRLLVKTIVTQLPIMILGAKALGLKSKAAFLTTHLAITRLQDLSGHFLLYNKMPPGAMMEVSKVMHMKSVSIMANHMPAHGYPHLILLLLKDFELSRM